MNRQLVRLAARWVEIALIPVLWLIPAGAMAQPSRRSYFPPQRPVPPVVGPRFGGGFMQPPRSYVPQGRAPFGGPGLGRGFMGRQHPVGPPFGGPDLGRGFMRRQHPVGPPFGGPDLGRGFMGRQHPVGPPFGGRDPGRGIVVQPPSYYPPFGNPGLTPIPRQQPPQGYERGYNVLINPINPQPIPDQQPGPVAPPVNSLPRITTPLASQSTPLPRNVLPQVNQVKRTVTPKVNKVGRPIAKAGPVTRRSAAIRANQVVTERTRELKKAADKAGLCPGKTGSKISMDRPLKQTKEVSVALSSYDPKAESNALVSVLECSLCVGGSKAGCCGAQDCTCGSMVDEELGCPRCVGGSIFNDLKQKGYLTDSDKQDFDTKYSKGDWAGIEKLLATKKVPPDLSNVYMKQIELAQRFNQYKDAAMTGAGGGQLGYLKGQFDAAAKGYNDAVQKAANLSLLKPEDFTERLLATDDISKRMDTIDQYAQVRDLSTEPFSPDPSGGLTLSGGPVMIFTDPDPSLPDGIMTQLGPDLVAIGTGGQGEPLVQVGSPSDVGYPLMSGPPVSEASTAAVERTSDQALVINPATTGATVNFVVDQTPYGLEAGLAQPLMGQPSWVIAYDRGGQAGEARYTLVPGSYSFTVNASGWDLVQKTFKVTLDNSANPDDFNYVLENQAGMVPARQAQEITSKLPIVLTFDRGDGREVAHKELAEGTYTIGIDPQTRLLELFPGPAAANAPLPSIANRTAAVPAPTTAPTTAPASVVSFRPTSTAVPAPRSPSTPVLP